MSQYRHGVFCLEGDWWKDLNQSLSVRPILELLNQAPSQSIDFIHRDVGTLEELDYYCKKWAQSRMKKYDILYLAFHGSKEGGVHVGDQRRRTKTVTLETLAGFLGPKLKGRIVHFGSCGTLAVERRRIQKFLRDTGALAVTGYKDSIEWMYSAAFEVLLFDTFTRYPFNRRGLARVERELRENHQFMCRKLDFRMEVSDSPARVGRTR